MERLLGLDTAPTAVIGINDLVAAGAMRCALEKRACARAGTARWQASTTLTCLT